TDVLCERLLAEYPDPELHIRFASPAQVGRTRVPRTVIKARAGGCVLLRVGLERRDSVAELGDVLVIPIRQHADPTLLARDAMFMLHFHLIAIEPSKAEVDRQNVGVLRRGNPTEAHGPVIPIEFGDSAP